MRDYRDTYLWNIVPTDDVRIQELLMRCALETRFFAQTVLGASFDEVMTYQHKDFWQLIDNDMLPKTVACVWRGFGKTTSMFAKVIKSILFRQCPFIVWVAKSQDSAIEQTEDIKGELLTNSFIRDVFGKMKAEKYEDQRLGFGKESWFVADPRDGRPVAYIVPKGTNQRNIRGINIRIEGKKQRPTFMVFDDVEDAEQVYSVDYRDKTRKWFFGSVLPCVPRIRPNHKTNMWNLPENDLLMPHRAPWRIFYADTPKHNDALILHLLNLSDWKTVKYAQSEVRKLDGKDEYFSLVPELISDEQVRVEVKVAKEARSLDEYYREKMCLPSSMENPCWTREMLLYYREEKIDWDKSRLYRCIVVDPARTAKATSAHTAILGVAAGWMADWKKNVILFRKLVNERLRFTEIYDRLFDMAIELDTRDIAIEITGMDDASVHLYRSEALKRGLNVNWLFLSAQGLPKGDFGVGSEAAKRARGSVILPYYEGGHVYHEEGLRGSALEMQELTYPDCTEWDALDCAGHTPKVLAKVGALWESQVLEDEKAPRFKSDAFYSKIGQRLRAAPAHCGSPW